MILGRDVLITPILRRREIAVPEWGGTVVVRELSLTEATELSRLDVTNRDDQMKAAALTVKFGWIDDRGVQVMHPDDELGLLMQQSVGVLTRIATAIADLSGMTSSVDLLDDAEKN